MERTVRPYPVNGTVSAPASKSHTIRALLIATLAAGESVVRAPLRSRDSDSCIATCRRLGAEIAEETSGEETALRVIGTAGKPAVPDDVIDVGNSGTTLYLAMGAAALAPGSSVFTGDAQIRGRTAAPLLAALTELGARAFSTRDNGCAPFVLTGPLQGGRTSIECPTSQYLSSLLLSLPLAPNSSELTVPLLYERPYVEMTLMWLARQGVTPEYEPDFSRVRLSGKHRYLPFDRRVPGDYSSATFPLCAAAICGTTVTVENLDPDDPQGDKRVIDILHELGCDVRRSEASATLTGPASGRLQGGEIDLNANPDALPALCAVGCYAQAPLVLRNVPQARAKETDRVAVMAQELSRLGVHAEPREDGIVVHPAQPAGGRVRSHGDHRIAMGLAVAALGAAAPVTIEEADACAVTYPGFFDDLERLQEPLKR